MKVVAAMLLVVGSVVALPVRAVDAPRSLQCWTDGRGQRTCGDSLPPQESKRQRDLMDKRGVVKQVVPAEKTPEEAAADARAVDDQKRQQAYDRYLMQTYQNVGEIEKVRDERLTTLDGRMTLAQKALTDNSAALEDLRQRQQTAPDPGETLDATLPRQIREFSQAREDNLSAISRISQERTSVTDQFARDIRRYQLLRESGHVAVPR